MSIFTELTGMDASHNAGIAQNAANKLTTQLGTLGTQNAAAYSQVPGAINTYQQGVNNNPLLSLFNNGTSNSPLVNAFGQAYGLNIGGTAQPGTNRTAGVPGNTGASGTATPSASGAQQPGTGSSSILPQNAYSLTQPQQIELNTQLNTLAQSQQSAVSAYQASFAQRGGSDPAQMAAGVAAINEQFAALAEQTSGAFAQSALKDRQTGLGDLMNGGQAASTAANAGNLNVADLLMQLGSQGAGQIGQAAGMNQANANTQQAQASADMSGVLNLIGTGLSGGFGNLFSGGGVPSGGTTSNTSAYGI